ncbi:MAG: AlpA family phage regulatory protein [Alphaproteobacteria bacterium]|nr:AlpA family phage regulatory protein [Pseudomonadota bacterium]MDE2465879.1 AlpA family phage regulatory protein [Alphaproteobacteria bacterium]
MRLLTISDIAQRVSFSKATVKHWAYRRRPAPAGFPNPIRVGRSLRWPDLEIDAWIASLAGIDQKQEEPTKPRRGRPRTQSDKQVEG